jgi:hypothetical protein
MVKFLDHGAFTEKGFDAAVDAVGSQGADDDLEIGFVVMAQKGGAEAAGAEDAQRLVAGQRERLELIGIEGDGAAQSGERFVPIAAFESGAVDVMMRLGPRNRIGHEVGDFLKIVLAGFQVADDDFELAKTVEQSGQQALLTDRQIAEALDKVLHHVAFAVAAEREAVARPYSAGMQVMPPLESGHRFVQFRTRLAGLVLFGLQI